jgi:hypothetical protein
VLQDTSALECLAYGTGKREGKDCQRRNVKGESRERRRGKIFGEGRDQRDGEKKRGKKRW